MESYAGKEGKNYKAYIKEGSKPSAEKGRGRLKDSKVREGIFRRLENEKGHYTN